MRKSKKKDSKKMDWETMIKKMYEIFQDINDSAKLIEESLKKIQKNNPNLKLPN
ncbi:MAG: hypothetical protein ACFFDK_11205 [Promethearchaeota archaeon]